MVKTGTTVQSPGTSDRCQVKQSAEHHSVQSNPCLRRSSYVFLVTTLPAESSNSSCNTSVHSLLPSHFFLCLWLEGFKTVDHFQHSLLVWTISKHMHLIALNYCKVTELCDFCTFQNLCTEKTTLLLISRRALEDLEFRRLLQTRTSSTQHYPPSHQHTKSYITFTLGFALDTRRNIST